MGTSIYAKPEIDKGEENLTEAWKKFWQRGKVPALVFVVLAGTFLSWQTIHSQQLHLEKSLDHVLMAQAGDVDQRLTRYIEKTSGQLHQVTQSVDFQKAETAFLDTGDGEQLLSLMEDSFHQQPETAVVLFRQGKGVLSTSGETDFYFSPEGEEKAVRACVNGSGKPYLAVLAPTTGGMTCGVVTTAQRERSPISGESRILLWDARDETLLYGQTHGTSLSLFSDFPEELRAHKGIAFLRTCGQNHENGVISYEGNGGSTRMAVLAEGENGSFTVAAATNYEGSWGRTAIWLLCFSGGAAAAAMVLALLLHNQKKTRDFQQEMELLRQKNTVMEELNRKTQQLAHHQRLQIMGTLTSSIAHEFNNLLTPIMGYSMMALEKLPEESEVYDDILEVYNTSRRAKELVSRLSDLSRKHSGNVFREIRPQELVKKTLDVASPAKAENVEVRTVFRHGDVTVQGNEVQLSQMLLNLVLNGFHAMEHQGGVLTMETDADEKNLYFRVSDTGTGIQPEVLPHIFDPFFTTKEAGHGTGLGLAIVQQAVEDYGGDVEVHSRLGCGTTFLVTIPRIPKPED